MHGGTDIDDRVVLDDAAIDALEPALDISCGLTAEHLVEALPVEHGRFALLAQALDHLPLAGEVVDRASEMLMLSLNLARIATDALAQIGIANQPDFIAQEAEQLRRIGLAAKRPQGRFEIGGSIFEVGVGLRAPRPL